MVTFSNQLYELRKQQIIHKVIEECEVDAIVQPQIKVIDLMRQEEAQVLRDINDAVEDLRVLAYYTEDDEDY